MKLLFWSFSKRSFLAAGCLGLACLGHAQTVDPAFSAAYEIVGLGRAPGVPSQYGGLTFKSDDANTLLLGGSANTADGAIYTVGLMRDTNKHITNFTATAATLFAKAPGGTGAGIDGGLAYGPSNILFFTTYNDNTIGQIKPGETNPAVSIPLAPLGIGEARVASVGSLNFVPAGFAGEGRLKILNFDNNTWYDTTISTGGPNGTFKINAINKSVLLPNSGPEGVIYVAAGNPGFDKDSVLVSEYGFGEVAAYEIDGNGDPIPESRRTFISNLQGAEGAAIDPLTGDFLFSTFGGSDQVLVVKGFTVNALNSRPSVAITSPADRSTFPAGANITLRADASDKDGRVVSVEFFRNGTSIGLLTNTPYQLTITNAAIGDYIFTARAVDNENGRSISPSVNVTVMSANELPGATLIGLTNGASFKAGSNLELRATADDLDGTIAKVEFYYNGANKIGESLAAPYRLTWTNLPAGSFAITAQAIDNAGGRGTSSPVNITVTAALIGSFAADKSFVVRLDTGTNVNYQFQASTNLKTWTTLTNINSGSSRSVQFSDPDASKFRYRFYRTQSP